MANDSSGSRCKVETRPGYVAWAKERATAEVLNDFKLIDGARAPEIAGIVADR